MLPSTLTSIFVPFLNVLIPNKPVKPLLSPPQLQFELRHLHAVSPSAHVLFSDVPPRNSYTHSSGQNERDDIYTIQTRTTSSFRPPSFEAFTQARTRSLRFGQSEDLRWDEEEIISPDVESRKTLLELAKMTNNAYVAPDDPAWYDLGGGWNSVGSATNLFCNNY